MRTYAKKKNDEKSDGIVKSQGIPTMQPILFFSSLFSNHHRSKSPFLSELVKAQQQIRPMTLLVPVPFRERLGEKENLSEQKWSPPEDIFFSPFFYLPGVSNSHNDYLMFLQALPLAKKIIRTRKPSLIHAHYLYPDGVAAGYLARFFNLPLVLTAHGSDLNILCEQEIIAKKVTKALFQAGHTTFVSNFLKEKAEKLAPGLKGSVVVNGVDCKAFHAQEKEKVAKKLGYDQEELIFLGIGSLIELKQFHILIKAFSQLPITKKRLILLGDGPLRQELEQLALSQGCGDLIDFQGHVPHSQVPDYLALADILTITSRSEGWPTIIFEALACGTYIIATPAGGIPEALFDKRYGTLSKDFNEQSFAKALHEGTSNSSTPKNDRIQYARQHSWQKIASQYESIYAAI